MMNIPRVFMIAAVLVLATGMLYALDPCNYTEFYDKVSYSPDIQPGVWNGRSDLCLDKARKTGWPMLWFIAARSDRENCYDFLRSNLCNQPFCDVVNNYKYLILCYEDYSGSAGKNLKNSIYGYPEPKKILDENSGQMVENHRGYPIKTTVDWTKEGEPITVWCDYPPSLHLLKVDASTNVIFHVCTRAGKYETEFSPYAEKFPIPSNMNLTENAFAPWFKQYLDMYPVSDQINAYESSESSIVYVTNTIYQEKVIAVTETINPTVYQMALHRDNILFRAVTMIGDVMVSERICENFKDFDGNISVRNFDGKWYVNHDRTLSSVVSSVSNYSILDILAKTNCILNASQRYGTGFSITGYTPVFSEIVNTQKVFSANGELVNVVTTNTVVTIGSPFMSCDIAANTMFTTNILSDAIYRVSTIGNSTFDVFSTNQL